MDDGAPVFTDPLARALAINAAILNRLIRPPRSAASFTVAGYGTFAVDDALDMAEHALAMHAQTDAGASHG